MLLWIMSFIIIMEASFESDNEEWHSVKVPLGKKRCETVHYIRGLLLILQMTREAQLMHSQIHNGQQLYINLLPVHKILQRIGSRIKSQEPPVKNATVCLCFHFQETTEDIAIDECIRQMFHLISTLNDDLSSSLALCNCQPAYHMCNKLCGVHSKNIQWITIWKINKI